MKLSDAERQRIHAATHLAEAHTAARFAVVTVRASDRYLSYPLVWAGLIALMTGAVIALLVPAMRFGYGVLCEAGMFAVIALVFDWLPLRLMIVPKRTKRERARNLAHREFAARILAASDRRPGVLLFVSFGERYVEVLATHDVHLKLGDPVWNTLVADLTAAAKAGHIVGGIEAAIQSCGVQLKAHFPKAV